MASSFCTGKLRAEAADIATIAPHRFNLRREPSIGSLFLEAAIDAGELAPNTDATDLAGLRQL